MKYADKLKMYKLTPLTAKIDAYVDASMYKIETRLYFNCANGGFFKLFGNDFLPSSNTDCLFIRAFNYQNANLSEEEILNMIDYDLEYLSDYDNDGF